MGAGGISIHAVDISRGIPAAGLTVRLFHRSQSLTEIAAGRCNDAGLLNHPVAHGAAVISGIYEVQFDVAAFYRDSGVSVPDPAFLEVAVFQFGIAKVEEHFHLPFKFTPWGYSLFRGGA